MFLLGILLLPINFVSASESMGTIDSAYKYAWGENIGWLNWGSDNGSIIIYDTHLQGYVWSEHYGWIDLRPSAGAYGGVLNNGQGALSGYAWGENVGWIDFAPAGYGVIIDSDGYFNGRAYNENTGYIIFNCTDVGVCAQSNFKVRTDWRPQSVRTETPAPSPGGGGNGPPEEIEQPYPYSVIINDGLSSTLDTNVKLTIDGGLRTRAIAISNFPDFIPQNTMPNISETRWDLQPLSCRGGEYCEDSRTVYVRFIADDGQYIALAFDSIILKSSPLVPVPPPPPPPPVIPPAPTPEIPSEILPEKPKPTQPPIVIIWPEKPPPLIITPPAEKPPVPIVIKPEKPEDIISIRPPKEFINVPPLIIIPPQLPYEPQYPVPLITKIYEFIIPGLPTPQFLLPKIPKEFIPEAFPKLTKIFDFTIPSIFGIPTVIPKYTVPEIPSLPEQLVKLFQFQPPTVKLTPTITPALIPAEAPTIIPRQLAKFVEFLLPSLKAPTLKTPRLEKTIPKTAPPSLAGRFALLPKKTLQAFVLAPLPKAVTDLTLRFPEFSKTLQDIGIAKLSDLQKLAQTKIILPSVTKIAGLPENYKIGIKFAPLAPEIARLIPEDVIFVKSLGGIDIPSQLVGLESGAPKQQIEITANEVLTFLVKPSAPASKIKGQVLYRRKYESGTDSQKTNVPAPSIPENQIPAPTAPEDLKKNIIENTVAFLQSQFLINAARASDAEFILIRSDIPADFSQGSNNLPVDVAPSLDKAGIKGRSEIPSNNRSNSENLNSSASDVIIKSEIAAPTANSSDEASLSPALSADGDLPAGEAGDGGEDWGEGDNLTVTQKALLKSDPEQLLEELTGLTKEEIMSMPLSQILALGLPQELLRLVLTEFEYQDADADGVWTANVSVPVVDGSYEVITEISYKNIQIGTKEIPIEMIVDPEGYIYEKLAGGRQARIPDAVVAIYQLDPQDNEYKVWPAMEYLQENPQTTDTTGHYSFLVPEGDYYLKVEAAGYETYKSKTFPVKVGGGVHLNIELKSVNWFWRYFRWEHLIIILLLLLFAFNIYRHRQRRQTPRS